LSGRARRIALLYAATAQAREARDAMADTPAMHSIEIKEEKILMTYCLSKTALRAVIPSEGNLMGGKSCMFIEVLSMVILVPNIYQEIILPQYCTLASVTRCTIIHFKIQSFV
jgi:hypothetical protein